MATTLSRKIGNQTMTFESGKLARQAEGSVVVTYGETQVLELVSRCERLAGEIRALRRAGDTEAVRQLTSRFTEDNLKETLRRLDAWEAGAAPTAAEYRELTLMALRLQCALWRPAGWWFALW